MFMFTISLKIGLVIVCHDTGVDNLHTREGQVGNEPLLPAENTFHTHP